MLGLYKTLITPAQPLLRGLLNRRLAKGKEDPERISERRGRASIPRPDGKLIWLHAASVGEAQSALILIEQTLSRYTGLTFLVTTGTRTSAELMARKLPERAIHQYYPLDHPKWVGRFLDHWQPDLCFWMESELWPNMILEIKERKIPAALINARLSERSFKRWKMIAQDAQALLSSFDVILAQTPLEEGYFKALGANNVHISDNLKYSAQPLSCDQSDLDELINAFKERTVWLYASTHKGEESLACDLHNALISKFPDLLTVIVPRHPDRGQEISAICEEFGLDPVLRRDLIRLPDADTDIYIANTIGELGLFYRACPIACIGRSFSDDGGGGHNPIEAALLGCAALHGPHVQNLQDIFDDMREAGAAIPLRDKTDFREKLEFYLSNPQALKALQDKGLDFAQTKSRVIDEVMRHLAPLLTTLAQMPPEHHQKTS